MNIKKILDHFKNRKYSKLSFSQSGEDLIVRFIFSSKGMRQPTYIDIGAHDPFQLSNTAHFYLDGSRGINIEPDPTLYHPFTKARKGDINLNIGIGIQKGLLDFYFLSAPTMNTFSKEEANNLVSEHGMSISKVLPVPVDTLPNIIDKYCTGKFPDFLSIDVEGFELEILETIDYQYAYPQIICVETISYSTVGKGKKDLKTINFLQNQDYILYADTYINSIFVRRSFWER